MDTYTTTQAATHFGVSAKTIRRWIRSGKLEASMIDGRWVIHNNAHDGSHLAHDGSHSAHLHSQLARADSEIAHLRDQLAHRDEQISSVAQQTNHLTQLLAIAQKNVAVLTEQLSASRQVIEDMRRRSWWKRIFRR